MLDALRAAFGYGSSNIADGPATPPNSISTVGTTADAAAGAGKNSISLTAQYLDELSTFSEEDEEEAGGEAGGREKGDDDGYWRRAEAAAAAAGAAAGAAAAYSTAAAGAAADAAAAAAATVASAAESLPFGGNAREEEEELEVEGGWQVGGRWRRQKGERAEDDDVDFGVGPLTAKPKRVDAQKIHEMVLDPVSSAGLLKVGFVIGRSTCFMLRALCCIRGIGANRRGPRDNVN